MVQHSGELTPNTKFPKVKYTVVEDGDNPVIYILPSVRFYKSTEDNTDKSKQLKSSDLNDNGVATTTINIVPVEYNDIADGTVNPTGFYFKIVTSKPKSNQKYLASQSIMGMPLTLPVKIRGTWKEPVVKMDVSLGYCFGYKLKIGNNPYKKTYVNFIPYAFAFNKETFKEKKEDKGEESVSFTYFAFGAMYEYQSFNVGAFVGWDMMFQPQDKWLYQKKAWLSIGIGYKLGKKE